MFIWIHLFAYRFNNLLNRIGKTHIKHSKTTKFELYTSKYNKLVYLSASSKIKNWIFFSDNDWVLSIWSHNRPGVEMRIFKPRRSLKNHFTRVIFQRKITFSFHGCDWNHQLMVNIQSEQMMSTIFEILHMSAEQAAKKFNYENCFKSICFTSFVGTSTIAIGPDSLRTGGSMACMRWIVGMTYANVLPEYLFEKQISMVSCTYHYRFEI